MKEIEELKILKNEHNKICTKKLRDLLKQYDIIKKEFDYESKKNNDNNSNKIIKNDNSLIITNKNISKSSKNMKTDVISDNNSNKDCYSVKKNNNKIKNYKSEFNKKDNDIKNIFDYYFKQFSEKRKKKINYAIKDNAFLYDNLNNLNAPVISNTNNNNTNESNNSMIVNSKSNKSAINNKSNNINNNYLSKKTLFTKSEKNFLLKLIPDKCLDNYEHKFNSLVNENINIKTKIIDNLKQEKNNKTHNIINLENSSLQNNIIQRKIIKLNSKITEYNKKKRQIIDKIKLNEKYMKYNETIYNKKINEFNKLLKDYKKIYDQIRNGKLFLKQGVQLTQDNIDAMDKYGMRGSNNTSVDGINEDVDFANVSEYENEEEDDENEEEGNEENKDDN